MALLDATLRTLFNQSTLTLASSLRATIAPPVEEIMDDITCHFVHEFNNTIDKCEFVRHNASCAYDGIFYNYSELTYCQLGSLLPLAIVILLLILLMLFVSIGSVADDFLCPSLLIISDVLRMPEHIAGVTFLAFGNSAPDIFSSISGISQAKPALIFGSLYGAGCFTTCVVTGLVLFSGEFAIMKGVVRDMVLYMGAVLMVWLFIFHGTLSLGHALGLVGYYIAYIIILIASRYLYITFRTPEITEEDFENVTTVDGSSRRSSVAMEPGAKSYDLESLDARSLRSQPRNSIRPSIDIHHHHYTPRSRTGSVASHMSGISQRSIRNGTYTFEDGIALTRYLYRGNIRSSRRRSRTGSDIKQHHVHHHLENTINHISKMYEADLKAGAVEDVRYVEDIEREKALEKAKAEARARQDQILDQIDADEREANNRKRGYTNEIKFTNNFSRPRYFQQLSTSSLLSRRSWLKAYSESRDFLYHIIPIDFLEWHQYVWYRKALEIIKAIPYFIMTICIPAVDIESPNENWNRMLICVNVIFAPQMILLMYNVNLNIGNVFPLWVIFLLVSIAAAVVIFYTAEKDKPPRYHRAFGFLGFIISVVFVNTIANEVISVLTTLGVIFGLSDSILGLTVLAWGNSLGDLIANNSLARAGYPGIAIAACFGGPLMNMLMGVGLPYSILLISEEKSSVPVSYSNMNTLLFVTLMTSLCVTISLFIINRFKSTRLHGIILLVLYVVYVIMAVLIEFKVFGSDT